MEKLECESCGMEDDVEELLICNSCGLAYHIFCLIPPLQSIPRRSWTCAKCIAKVRVNYCYIAAALAQS